MSTFLDLCKDVRRECGLSGTGPAGVQNQVGMDEKIVNWVKNAWIDIQESQRYWRFMWKNDGLITCTIGNRSYDPVSLGFDVRNLELDSVTCRLPTETVKLEMNYIDYESFRSMYLNITPTPGRPNCFTWTPDNKILLNPIPSAEYQIEFEYYRNHQTLATNTDVPIMPTRYHQLLVYYAMVHYASHDDAVGVYQDANIQLRKWQTALQNDQCDTIQFGGSLA